MPRRSKKHCRVFRTKHILIRWSIQEIRRIAIKLAQRRIQPAHVIAWSLWRRAHQAEARRAHLKSQNATVMLEPIQEVEIHEQGLGLVKRRSMMRIMARRMKAATVRCVALEVAGQATVAADPGEGALDDPSLGQDDEAMQHRCA